MCLLSSGRCDVEWVKLYTRLPRDPAIRASQHRHQSAPWLFVLGLCYVGEQESDGHIPAAEPAYWAVSGWKRAADALVAEGLWEPELEGGWRVRSWSALQVSSDKATARRANGARRAALHRDQPLKAAVRERDEDSCRYCGVPVVWGAGKARNSGSFDHVDPDGPNTLANLVVACVPCNSKKCNRSLEESRMTLRPVTRDVTRLEQSREERPPYPPQAGGAFRSACERHKARAKAGCADCARPAPTRPDATPVHELCPHGRHEPTCPFCPELFSSEGMPA